MKRRSKQNIAAFSRIQRSPSRIKYLLKQVSDPIQGLVDAYKTLKAVQP